MFHCITSAPIRWQVWRCATLLHIYIQGETFVIPYVKWHQICFRQKTNKLTLNFLLFTHHKLQDFSCFFHHSSIFTNWNIFNFKRDKTWAETFPHLECYSILCDCIILRYLHLGRWLIDSIFIEQKAEKTFPSELSVLAIYLSKQAQL